LRVRIIFFAACLLLCGYIFAESEDIQPSAGAPVYIRVIDIHGNVTTRPQTLEAFFDFRIGEELDTAKLRSTRENILRTQLYTEVDIAAYMLDDGARIVVTVKEAVRLQLIWGGSYSTTRYGVPDLWIVLRGGATLYNFRGRMEELSIEGKVWALRGVNALWTKPFLSTPYYISAGAGVETYPDEALPLDFVDLFVTMAAGKMLGKHSKIALSATPMRQNNRVVESQMDDSPIPTPNIPEYRSLYEAFGAVTFTSDYRNSRFDTRSGWYETFDVRTNWLYHDNVIPGVYTPFFEFTNDFKYYLPLLFGDVLTTHLRLTMRDTDAGTYHRLTYGGTGSMRGYHDKALGWNFVANSAAFVSLKYTKPIWKTQPLNIPLVESIYQNAGLITIRFDLSLIADYVRLFDKPLGPLALESQTQDALGLGFGLRTSFLELRQSGNVEVVFGKRERPDHSGFDWKPMLHFSLDRGF
jgi:outer membrane protein assembly factor BamA